MTGDKFLNSYRETVSKYGIVKFILVFLVVMQVLQAIALFYAISHQTVVIVPTSEINKRFQIKGTTADMVYVEQMVRHFINLLNNYTPETIEQNFQEVLYYVAPADQPEFKKFLIPEEKAVKATGISRAFAVIQVEHNLKENSVKVYGIEKRIIADKVIYSGKKVYQVNYYLDNGRFFVKSVVDVSEASPGNPVTPEKVKAEEEQKFIEQKKAPEESRQPATEGSQ